MSGKKFRPSKAVSLTELLDFCTAEKPPELTVRELFRLNASARRHGLSAFFQYAAVKKFGFTLDEIESSEDGIIATVQHLKILAAREKVRSLLMKKNLRFCFIKGGDLAFRAYPEPQACGMGDLDILVHPDDERQVYDALVNDGWTAPPGVEDYGKRHHVVMGKNGVSLERHYTLPMVDRERIRAFWDGFVSRTDKDGCVLSWEQSLVVVFAHSMSHTWRNSGRLLADCIMIFRKTAQNKERVDLDRIRKCAACCGIPSPEILLAAFSEYLPGCPVKKTDFPENMVNMFREIVENGDALSTVDYTVPQREFSFRSPAAWSRLIRKFFSLPETHIKPERQSLFEVLSIWFSATLDRSVTFFNVAVLRRKNRKTRLLEMNDEIRNFLEQKQKD